MNRSTLRVLSSAALALAFATAPPAQSETAALAAAIVRSQMPATDDPDAWVRDLVSTALTHRRSPVAWFLVQEAIFGLGQVQDPRGLRDTFDALAKASAGERQHGRLQQKCIELRWWLDRACDGPVKAGAIPALGYCKQAVVAGPFGDDGENFVGIPMAPEFRFPAIGAELPGRGTTARVRQVATRPGSDYVELHVPGQPMQGCYYALHRFAVDAATDAFLEIEFDGDFQLFVDDAEVLRVERWKATAPRRHYPGLHLPAGTHTVLLKTCSFEKDRYTMRWLDADAAPLAAVRQIAVDDPVQPSSERATPTQVAFVTADDVLARAAEQPGADPSVRIAAMLLAEREANHDLALRLGEPLRRAGPADPVQALAFARVLRFAPLPDELRKAEARKIEEPAIAALPAEHHGARLAKVALLAEQDQREQALRLLADHPAPGPATFQRRHGLIRELKFAAEEVPLLEEWTKACPRDPRPLLLLADAAGAAADGATVVERRRRAALLQPDLQNAAQAAVNAALDIGDADQARAWIDAIDPQPGTPPDVRRLVLESNIAQAGNDTERLASLLQQLAAHPDANAALLLDVASRFARLPDNKAATVACLRRCLERDPDQPKVRAWLSSLGELPPDDAAFVAFRRDGDAARAAFTASDREQTASSTVLIDQRIVELRADGSWTSETHELRRINDQAGVDAFRTAAPLDNADEVLLVRTIGADGRIWVPARVEKEYALQRLEPGVFVEWRYRERGSAPGAEPAHAGSFLFGSESEPVLLSELVVIEPPAGRVATRTRGLGEPTETRDLGDGRKVVIFRRENIPSLPREQFLPPIHELVPFAELGEDGAPFAALRDTRVQVGRRTRPTAPIQAQAQALFADLSGDRAIVETAWAWCQKEIESGPADSALDTLLHKKGSRFLLAVALVRAGGLTVVPLACLQARPELNPGGDWLFAAQDPYDVPGALVTLANGERIHLFVDTPRHWPLGAVPASRAGSTAMALFEDRTEAIVLPGSSDAVQALRVRGDARIEGTEIRVEATVELGDVQGFGLADRIRELKENQQKQAARQIAQQLFAGFRVKNAFFPEAPPGTPMRITASLSRAAVQAKGDGFVMQLPLSPMKFVASFGDRAERTLPYQFLGDLISDWQIDVDAGDAHRFVGCPDPVAIRMGPLTHDLQCTRIGDKLRFVRHTRLGPATLPANRFGEWLRALAAADRADQVTVDLAAKAN